MSEWQPIETPPARPMAVLFLSGKGRALYEADCPDFTWDWSLPEN